ncbi:MAG: hypothetical protein FWB96_11075 [Defluviitaleaceae bacterium]|nr:hypothetical protein [Defluviitaleaceae bacterium]MCL2263521.1 hypothetical protein [Defluviitaleaceae bacterium]
MCYIARAVLDKSIAAYVLQLKFANIGTTGVSSARVCIGATDSADNPAYPEISVTYEEFTASGGTFGAKKLLPLPNNTAANFSVYVMKVVTVDGNTLSFPREQYSANVDKRDLVAEQRMVESVKREEQNKAKELSWSTVWYRPLFAFNGVILLLFTLWSLSAYFIRPRIWNSNFQDGSWAWLVRDRGLLPDILIPSFRTVWWMRSANVSTFTSYLLNFAPMILLLLLFWYVWFSTWRSIGTPGILRRTAIMAIFMPLGHFLFDTVIALWLWTSLELYQWNLGIPELVRLSDIFVFSEFMLPFTDFGGFLRWMGFFLLFTIPFVCVFLNIRRYDKSIKLSRSLMFWLPPQEGEK